MSDLPPKITDIPREKIKPPVIEEKVDINDFYSPEVQEILGKVESGINHIVSGNETKKDIKELNNEYKGKFIEKIKNKLKKNEKNFNYAIENGTLKIAKIPKRDLIAISLNGSNLDYIFNYDGTLFEDLSWRREDRERYILFLDTLRDYNLEEKFENGKFILYKNGKKINTFSSEYYNEILKPIDFIKHFVKALEESLK